MEDEDYALTEAEVLDAVRLVVAAERRASAVAKERSEDGTLEEPDEPETPPPEDAARTTASKSNPYQNRQKQELEYLKAKVRELERQLRHVETEKDAKLAQEGDSMWQRMAQQQYVESQKALSENARLKEMLDGQIKFAKSLERVLRKRPNLMAFGGAESDGTRRRRRKKAATATLYDELSEIANTEYKRTAEALEVAGMMQIVRDSRSIEVKVLDGVNVTSNSSTVLGGGSDMRVDFMITRRYPFPFAAVGRELWNCLSHANTIEQVVDDLERKIDKTDDTMFATTTLKFPVTDRSCTLSASALLRRFEEEDSCTVVWVSDGECEPKKSSTSTFKLYEHGWMTMQPMPGDPSSCISRTLGYYYPSFSARSKGSPASSSEVESIGSPADTTSNESSAETPEEIGILTELLSSVYARSANQIHSVIENALMVQALQHKA